MRPARIFLLLAILCCCTPSLRAQQQDDVLYRLELGGGVGAAFGLTDVNSKWYGQTSVGAALIARWPLNARMAIKANLDYAAIRGNTSGVKKFYPADPAVSSPTPLNYSVSTGVVDASALYELHFLPYGFYRGYKGFCRLVPYIQFGLGATYGVKKNAFTLNIPLGVGIKYKVAERLNLGLDWTFHLSLSDRLDGLDAPLGIESSGFRNKDHYCLTLITLTYDLRPKCPTCNKAE